MTTDNTVAVLDHGYVRLRNLAGPTRRQLACVHLSYGPGTERGPTRPFDADDIDPAQAARMSFEQMDTDRTAMSLPGATSPSLASGTSPKGFGHELLSQDDQGEAERVVAAIDAHLSEPQAASHPLADDQIDDEWAEAGKRGTGHMATYLQAREFCRAIEAAHGIGDKS